MGCVCVLLSHGLEVLSDRLNDPLKEVFAWQDLCITLDDRGIFEKEMYQSKEYLKNNLLIIENPKYQSGLYRIYTEHVKEKMNSK